MDIGAYNSQSYSGVFSYSQIPAAIENGNLHVPEIGILPGTQNIHNIMFLADQAFPLKSWLMRPYPASSLNHDRKIFNYRLSRARRIVENAFGILAARWRIFCRPMEMTPDHAVHIVKAAVVLHNFLKYCDSKFNPVTKYEPTQFLDNDNNGVELNGKWRGNKWRYWNKIDRSGWIKYVFTKCAANKGSIDRIFMLRDWIRPVAKTDDNNVSEPR